MIILVLAMAWARRGQTVALALLSLLGVAAAVAAPAYLRAADRAVAAARIESAPTIRRSLAMVLAVPDQRGDDSSTGADPAVLRSTTGLTALPGFRYVYGTEIVALGMERDALEPTRMIYRQDVCAHLTVIAGRCLVSESDVVIGEETARRLGVRPGGSVTLRFARYSNASTERGYLPDGEPKKFVVTGVYRFSDPGEAYWGAHDYFSGREPAFVTEDSLDGMDIGARTVSVDGYAGPGALDVDKLPAVRADLDELRVTLGQQGTTIDLQTRIPELLAQIDAGRAALHAVVPVLAVALVLLACLSIFLAVGYGTDGRRPELAVVALRGARFPQRWWLGAGENVVAIVAGGVLGCVAGQLLINAITAIRFPGVGADPGFGSLRWAPAAIAAALVTALLAERRQLVTPVLELLRRAPAIRGTGRAIAFEVAVLLLAATATAQLVLSGGTLTGVGTFATGLVLIAAALIAARLLMRGITAYSRRALAAGRLGIALAGLHLARRPGGVRLLALLVAAVAVTGYATSAVDVAAHGREAEASLSTGAARVVPVAPVTSRQLLAAVERADPGKRFAMAAVRIPGLADDPPVLAVDTTRLAAVAAWPDGAPAKDEVARALRPAAADPVHLSGRVLALDISAEGFGPRGGPVVTLLVSSATGDQIVRVGQIQPGRRVYHQTAEVCAKGCELDAIRLRQPSGSAEIRGSIRLHDIRGGDWRATEGGQAAGGGDGLQIRLNLVSTLDVGVYVQPADGPDPLPVATAGGLAAPTIVGLDGLKVPVSRTIALPLLPGVGRQGTLVDLDYADKLTTDVDLVTSSAVWLSADAPPDILDRLRAAGLAPTGDIRADRVRATLDRDGPALGLLFSALVGALAALLAAGALTLTATVDRARRVEDLRALRDQGLPLGDLRRATLWTYPALAAVAVIAGMLIGVAGWLITGWALPLPDTWPYSRWPSLPAMLGAAVAVAAILMGVSALAGRRTLRSIR